MESTLALQLSDLREEVGQYLGFQRDYSVLDAGQQAQVSSTISAGLRQFYFPPVLEGDMISHRWSFLTPSATLTVEDDKADYDLPDDFGGLEGEFTYAADAGLYQPICRVGVGDISSLRQGASLSTGAPQKVALRPKKSDGTAGQRFAVEFWPTPDAEYVLSYRYRVMPSALSATNPHPYGGASHSETILESCLAVAESRIQDEQGNHKQAFLERLRASVALDQRDFRPDYYGYNANRQRAVYRRHQGQTFATYNGNLYP